MSDHPTDSAVPIKVPEVTSFDPSPSAVPASAQTSAEVTTNSAPLETVIPPAAKDVAPSLEVVAPAEVPAKSKKVIATKPLPSQKGQSRSSQPSIADMLCKGDSTAKPGVSLASDTQLVLHKSRVATTVTQQARGKVMTHTESGNSLSSLVEYANNWNAADQLEGNPSSQPFQLSDISSRLHMAAKIVLESDKMNKVSVPIYTLSIIHMILYTHQSLSLQPNNLLFIWKLFLFIIW